MNKPIVAPSGPGGDQLAAGFRQLLLMLGGAAVTRGYVSEAEVEMLVGAAVLIGTFLYGQWKTRKRARDLGEIADHVPNSIAMKD